MPELLTSLGLITLIISVLFGCAFFSVWLEGRLNDRGREERKKYNGKLN